MFKQYIKLSLLLLSLTLAPLSYAADFSLGFIQLKHRDSQSIIPLLKPFVSPQGTLSGQGYQLIVRTTPDNLETLKAIVQRFDVAVKQLVIFVTQDSRLVAQDTEASLSIDARHSNSRITINRGHGGNQIWLRHTKNRSNDNLGQQLRVLDGHEAWIQTGQDTPVPSNVLDANGNPTGGIYYKPVTSGFYVLPRLQGNMVELEISPNKAKQSNIGFGNIKTQSAHSNVRVKLGEWINLGGNINERNARQNGILQHSTHRSKDEHSIYIKVELSQ